MSTQLQPRRVGREVVEGQVAQARFLGTADAILQSRMGAVPRLQIGDVSVGLIGDENLKAVAVDVAEAELRAPGWGVSPRQMARGRSGHVLRSRAPRSA